MMHVHANGILKEIEVPSHTNFETMCRDILIEEGIVKTCSPLDYGEIYWSNVLEKLLHGKYVVVQDQHLSDRLFKICKFESELIEEHYDFNPTNNDGEYEFDIVCDETKFFSEALSRAVYGKP